MAQDNENMEMQAETGIAEETSEGIKPGNPNGISESAGKDGKERPHDISVLNKSSGSADQSKIGFILDIPLVITVELGRTKMLINELLKLGQGSIIELSKNAGGNLEILANQKLVARGEVVVVNEKYGIRLTEIVSPTERIESLK
jgi:flagellar motor switch protein FliN/FliY